MKQIAAFPLEDGGSILVEVDEPAAAGPVVRGLGQERSKLVEQAGTSFEEATAAVTPAAHSLISRLRAVADPPDEIGLEFGLQLSAQTGAFIASVAAEANFKVSMTWRRQDAGTAEAGSVSPPPGPALPPG
jgi:Trypsin-co-occurring domain 1